jgi:alpha/beta superfamily hydrolase
MARSEKITFMGSHGVKLVGRLDSPDGSPHAHALFAHCFTCSKDVAAASRISRALSARGTAVLRFDFTGLGGSDGEFANTSFSSNVQDLVAAASWLREHARAPNLLVGHSLGGAAVLMAAHEVPECEAVATIGAPFDPAHVKHLLTGSLEDIERDGSAEVVLAGRTFTIERHFIEDLERQSREHRIEALGRALLIFHSPVDSVVGIDNARRIYEEARHPKSFLALDGADHLLTRREDADYVGAVLAAWAKRYLPEPQ